MLKTVRKQDAKICINRTNSAFCIENSIENNAASNKEKIGKEEDSMNIVFWWKIQLSNDWLQNGKHQDISGFTICMTYLFHDRWTVMESLW